MKTLPIIILITVSQSWAQGLKSITLPTQAEVRAELAAMNSRLAELGIDNPRIKFDAVDWAHYIEAQQEKLMNTGGGKNQKVGTIFAPDHYPVSRTVNFKRRVRFEGKTRAHHHIGTSCGLVAADSFQGEFVAKWDAPSKAVHSNFGAGIHQIHIDCNGQAAGVLFYGAQQASGISNLFVKDFESVGIQLGGDAFDIDGVFIEGRRSPGSIGIKTVSTVQSMTWENVTAHEVEIGIALGNANAITINNFETELTTLPVRVDYNCEAVSFEGAFFRHTSNVLQINRAKFPSTFSLSMKGSSHSAIGGKRSGTATIQHPEGNWSTGSVYDFAIEGEREKKAGKWREELFLIDNKAERKSNR